MKVGDLVRDGNDYGIVIEKERGSSNFPSGFKILWDTGKIEIAYKEEVEVVSSRVKHSTT